MADGRFAPSPTGPLHLGNLRTALLAWLYARSAGSRFLVRVEDLDPVASRPEHEQAQLDDLAALGLDWDGPVIRQRDRREAHEAAVRALADAGRLYPCYCTRKEILAAAQAPHGELPEGAYPGTCRRLGTRQRAEREAAGRRPAWRLDAGGVDVGFVDRLHGPVRRVVDDLVVRRNDGVPAYNLAVVVDDAWQGVEEVVRGDDLLLTTPRQLHLAALLGVTPPRSYAHVPLVLGPGGQRLAKRDGAVTLADQRARGRTADEVRSLLAHSLGLCAPGEPVTPGELVARFDPASVGTQPWTIPATLV